MKKTIVLHLLLGAVSVFLILFFAHGICHLQIDFWEWRDPDTPVRDSVSNAMLILKCSLFIIPALLLVFGIAYMANRVSDPKLAIHTLGVSIFLTACLVGLALSQVMSPMFSSMITTEMIQGESSSE